MIKVRNTEKTEEKIRKKEWKNGEWKFYFLSLFLDSIVLIICFPLCSRAVEGTTKLEFLSTFLIEIPNPLFSKLLFSVAINNNRCSLRSLI